MDSSACTPLPPRGVKKRTVAKLHLKRPITRRSEIDAFSYRGHPRSPEDWAALAKIASGQPNLTKDELRRLFMLGLVDRELGRVCLSVHGRATLGLSDEYH